jgi:hypothetical protein
MYFTRERDNNGSLLPVAAVQERVKYVAFRWHHTEEVSSKIKQNRHKNG